MFLFYYVFILLCFFIFSGSFIILSYRVFVCFVCFIFFYFNYSSLISFSVNSVISIIVAMSMSFCFIFFAISLFLFFYPIFSPIFSPLTNPFLLALCPIEKRSQCDKCPTEKRSLWDIVKCCNFKQHLFIFKSFSVLHLMVSKVVVCIIFRVNSFYPVFCSIKC